MYIYISQIQQHNIPSLPCQIVVNSNNLINTSGCNSPLFMLIVLSEKPSETTVRKIIHSKHHNYHENT